MSQGKFITSNKAARAIGALLQNVDFGCVDPGVIDQILGNPRWAGRQFTEFLGGLKVPGSPIIQIDRTIPFYPEEFLGEGWTVEEEDERALKLTEVDLSQVKLETTLEAGETSVNGEKRLKRLKRAGKIRLDAKTFLTLWNNPHLIPESWKKPYLVSFDDTVLRSPDGSRYVLCLRWDGDRWRWSAYWLAYVFGADCPSAVLDQGKLAA